MKIFGIGMNYAAHNKELQNSLLNIEDDSAQRSQPVVFTKADSALLTDGRPFFIPSYTKRCEYETELCVRINHLGRSIPERFAHRYYDEVGLGIDFTARDVQRAAAEAGEPWEMAKAFDHSAAISPEFVKLSELGGDVQNLRFEMMLNGEVRQSASTSQMIFTVDQLISHISQFVTLKIGDLIYTGTPVGVGEVKEGDELTATLEGRKLLDFDIR